MLPMLLARLSFVPVFVLLLGATLGCVAGGQGPVSPPQRDTISILSPRCAGIRSCVLGHVTAASSAAPVAQAAVFLVRDAELGEQEPVRFLTLTDEQGVFIVGDPPPGSYRIAIYKDDSGVEVSGMELGDEGTTLLPVRLALF